MKKILNKRLSVLSAFVENNEIVLDIGCDHGLLGIYLYLNRKNIKIIGSDINPGPLKKAQENIHKYQLEDKIELRLADGLKAMSNDVTTVVISGMGSQNIVNILKEINNFPNVCKLILSPNNDFPLLRKKIMQFGFMITREEIVMENDKYYLISEFKKGNKKADCFFGKVNFTDNSVQEYYQYLYKQNNEILSKLNFINKIKRIDLIRENYKIKNTVTFKRSNLNQDIHN